MIIKEIWNEIQKGNIERTTRKRSTAVGKRGDVECHWKKGRRTKPRKKAIQKEMGKGARKGKGDAGKRGEGASMVQRNHRRQGETDGKRNTARKEGERRDCVELAFWIFRQQWQRNQSNVPLYPNNQPPKDPIGCSEETKIGMKEHWEWDQTRKVRKLSTISNARLEQRSYHLKPNHSFDFHSFALILLR